MHCFYGVLVQGTKFCHSEHFPTFDYSLLHGLSRKFIIRFLVILPFITVFDLVKKEVCVILVTRVVVSKLSSNKITVSYVAQKSLIRLKFSCIDEDLIADVLTLRKLLSGPLLCTLVLDIFAFPLAENAHSWKNGCVTTL